MVLFFLSSYKVRMLLSKERSVMRRPLAGAWSNQSLCTTIQYI